MGCAVELTDTGVEVQIHRFDKQADAEAYVTLARGYTFDRHETWPGTMGLDFYKTLGGGRASIRKKGWKGTDYWQAAFWWDLSPA